LYKPVALWKRNGCSAKRSASSPKSPLRSGCRASRPLRSRHGFTGRERCRSTR